MAELGGKGAVVPGRDGGNRDWGGAFIAEREASQKSFDAVEMV